MRPADHTAYLCLGSNIDPAKNLRRALELLRERTQVKAISTCWETAAVGSGAGPVDWPNFFNLGVCITTTLEPEALKDQVIRPIETALGRVRGPDKYAPRTIDIDLTIYDEQVFDQDIWQRVYLALIFAEMLPNLRDPATGAAIQAVADHLQQAYPATPHPEIQF